ncbi:hypothetical protein CVT24_008355 [Panaeolus cyanescens]|uniref:DUF676 domain-containing protein n=1 Tax=Panaeolus cyanescens TaxID=181874 RepID=A0A409VC51_9AGAR|nr:hypothetical protein CVT24_008355 [Panaeolus cyanescens]
MSSTSTTPVLQSQPPPPPPQVTPDTIDTEHVVLTYIHGFKGDDQTFGDFPQRLEHVLCESLPHVKAESVVFPVYETKGELDKAIVRFADWLTTLTVEREVAIGKGAGTVKIVLCGHSMGGLLAADTLREFYHTRPDKSCPLWPKIIACLAFDTPYLGLNPGIVKNGVTKVAEYASAATTVGSAIFGSLASLGAKKATESPTTNSKPTQANASAGWGWGSAAFAVGGALLAGAAAGGAYYKRDDLNQGFTWATDHLKYVGNLWDENSLQERVDALVRLENDAGVLFRTIYTLLPPNPPDFLTSRTFVVLPKYSNKAKNNFLPANNSIAQNEIQAHTGMFSASTNDGYYQLGLTSAKLVREAILNSRGVTKSPPSSPRRARSPVSPAKDKSGDLIELWKSCT